MKAEVGQQLSLLEVAKLDAELSRLAHSAEHLPQREVSARLEADRDAAVDRLGALGITLDDIDAQISRLEADIDAVRQREQRDRSLLSSGTTDVKQLPDLQHELDTLERRQRALEDSLLEVMEQREEFLAQRVAESAVIAGLDAEIDDVEREIAAAMAGIDQARDEHLARRELLIADLPPELLAIYERQRTGGGAGAGALQANSCGACRIEIGRGELLHIKAAPDEEIVRCPECNAILVRVGSAAS